MLGRGTSRLRADAGGSLRGQSGRRQNRAHLAAQRRRTNGDRGEFAQKRAARPRRWDGAEANSPNVQLLVKDDKGTSDGAAAAAQEAINEGAELIVGPLIAANVQAAAAVARPAGRPMIAFSSDASVASRGVYLLSFMPGTDVQRVVSYAAAQGKHSFAALVPDTAYGQVTSGAFQEAVTRAGGRVVALEHYGPDHNQTVDTVKRLAPTLQEADALFIPDGADTLPAILEALVTGGVDLKRLKLIGTGVWNDPKLFRLPQLQGAWFPAPEPSGFAAFAQRYRARYNTEPSRIASLSYDALSLAAALVRTQGSQRFSETVLTRTSSGSSQALDGQFPSASTPTAQAIAASRCSKYAMARRSR